MLNFGQIRERYEGIVGEPITTLALANRIDEAQTEIAKQFGKRTRTLYPPPVTELAAGINADAETIVLDSGVDMPEPPATAYLGGYDSAEKITYDTLVGDQLQDVTRGVNDTEANAWPAGTPVTIPVQAEMENPLPADCLEVHEVRGLDNVRVFNYQISDDMEVLFFGEGLYRLIYTPVPNPIDHNDNNAVPEVHQVFHKDILTYCIYKYWEDNAEGIQGEEQKATTLLTNFHRSVISSAKKLRQNSNQQHTIGIELWG